MVVRILILRFQNYVFLFRCGVIIKKIHVQYVGEYKSWVVFQKKDAESQKWSQFNTAMQAI